MTRWRALTLAGLAGLGLGLVASITEAAIETGRYREGRGRCGREGCGGTAPPFFEFAPASGAGMTAACACTAPTGSKGEALTFTRGSTAWCTKGSETSGIAEGDLVECASGQPRVMPGGDGTGGVGLNVWEARTNIALRSNEFENAAWVKYAAAGGVTPVVTVNIGLAPDGTQSADRLWTSGCDGGSTSASLVYQQPSLTDTTPLNGSVYVRGCIDEGDGGCAAVASLAADAGPMRADGGPAIGVDGGRGSGSISVSVASTADTNKVAVSCSYSAGSWRRCSAQTVSAATTGPYVLIGCLNDTTYTGHSDTGVADVLLWQGQLSAAASLGPPITTTTTSATRVAEVATFSVALTGTTRSLAATYVPPSTFTAGSTALQIYFDANNDTKLYATSTASTSTVTSDFRIGGASNTKATTATMTASSPAALAGYYDGAARYACLDGTCLSTAGALTLPTGTATVYLGGRQAGAGFAANGTVKKVCIDPSPGRCR